MHNQSVPLCHCDCADINTAVCEGSCRGHKEVTTIQEVELCQNVTWCIGWARIIWALFVLAYQACGSNLRWTGKGGGRGVSVPGRAARAPQLRDVLEEHWGSKWPGRLEVHSHELLMQWQTSGRVSMGDSWPDMGSMSSFCDSFPFNPNTMLFPQLLFFKRIYCL